MKQRFEGENGLRLLVDTLKDQKLVGGDLSLAGEIAATGELLDVAVGTPLIEQGAEDNDVFLILSGSFVVLVNGKPIAKRGTNDHVGEMAAIQQTQRRSATVLAEEPCVVLKLTEPQITALAHKYPDIYRFIAKELARRLMQRNFLIASAREKIRVFVISSVEALAVARGVQSCFDHDPFTVTVWTDGVFRASHYPIESLEKELDQSDFAIAIDARQGP